MDLGYSCFEWMQSLNDYTSDLGDDPISQCDTICLPLDEVSESLSDLTSCSASLDVTCESWSESGLSDQQLNVVSESCQDLDSWSSSQLSFSSDSMEKRFDDAYNNHSAPLDFNYGLPQDFEIAGFNFLHSEMEESSLNNQEHTLVYDNSITNQEYASGSSSDDSTDSNVSINCLITCEPMDLSTKRKRKAKKPWSKLEDEKLLIICREVNIEKNCRQWNEVARRLSTGRTAKQCREHWGRLQSGNKKNNWSADEDVVLESFLDEVITYDEVTKRLNRSVKQIKERLNLLKRNRNPWSEEEDHVIMSFMRDSKKQREICTELKKKGFQRTGKQVKDRMAVLSSKFHP